MTTASKPSGSGSPVSTTSYAPASRYTGVLSLAPTVSAARTAIPSIAEASNDGDDRAAHTGSAVTRPSASASASATTSTRSGQPAASHAARHAARAAAAGTSWMKGVVAIRWSVPRPTCPDFAGPWMPGGDRGGGTVAEPRAPDVGADPAPQDGGRRVRGSWNRPSTGTG